MKKQEITVLASLVAQMITEKMGKGTSSSAEFVDINVAAEMLGYSTTYMRQIKNRFPYIKVGNHKQGRIMFKRTDIENYYNINIR